MLVENAPQWSKGGKYVLEEEKIKRTEYYREWERAHRAERNEYHRRLYRLKKEQIQLNI